MSPVDFKKRLCRPLEFKGQGPKAYYIDQGLKALSEGLRSVLWCYLEMTTCAATCSYVCIPNKFYILFLHLQQSLLT